MCSTAHTQAQSCSITTQLLKKSPLNRTLVHRVLVKARPHARSTGSAEMQAKRRRPWLLLPRKKCQLAPLIVYNCQFGGMTTTEWLKPPIGTQVSHNDTAATNSFFHSQSTTLSFPDPLCTCWLIWPCATRLFPVSPFHPQGGVSTPPRAWRRVDLCFTPTEENLHSTAKKYWCLI